MKPGVVAISWAVLLVLGGCAAQNLKLDQERRLLAVQAAPELSPQVRQAILDGRLLLGMTDAMVAATWGLPRQVDVRVGGDLRMERWEYGASQTGGGVARLTFDDGLLIDIERSQPWLAPLGWEGMTRPTGDGHVERAVGRNGM